MLIAGSGGHAKEILQILIEDEVNPIVFFNDVSASTEDKLYNTYAILKDINLAKALFLDRITSYNVCYTKLLRSAFH